MYQILEHSEATFIRLCLMEILRKVLGHGTTQKKKWYEYFGDYVTRSDGDGEWLFEGRIHRAIFRFLNYSEIFVIRIGSGWQVADGETRRYLYWSAWWDEGMSHSFADLHPLIEKTIEGLAKTLGKDGVVLKPSPEQLAAIEFGELSKQAKKTGNGSGAHLDDFPEVSGTPS